MDNIGLKHAESALPNLRPSKDSQQFDYKYTEGVVISQEWRLRIVDVLKFIVPGVLMLISGILLIACSVPVWLSEFRSVQILKLVSNVALLMLTAAAGANIANVSRMMLVVALHNGSPINSLRSSIDSSLYGVSCWMISFSNSIHLNIRRIGRIIYILIIIVSVVCLILTPIILAIGDTAGEWTIGTYRLSIGRDILSAYEAYTAASADFLSSKKSDIATDNIANNIWKFGMQNVDRLISVPDDDTGTIQEYGQVWSGSISMIATASDTVRDNEIGGSLGYLYDIGIGVVGTVDCSKTDIDSPRELTDLEMALLKPAPVDIISLQNRTCLGMTIERLNVSSVNNSITYYGRSIKDMHVLFNLVVYASATGNSKCMITRATCGLSVTKTHSQIQYRDGRLVNWGYHSIAKFDDRDKHTANIVFQWLQGATTLVFANGQSSNLTQMININRFKILDTASLVWPNDKMWGIDHFKSGLSYLFASMLQKFLRASMMSASSSASVEIVARADPDSSWEAKKSKVDAWLRKHGLSSVNAVSVSITQNTGRPFGLVGLILGCAITAFGLALITYYALWYASCGPTQRLIWDRLSNFTKLSEALAGLRVGQDHRDCASREPIKVNKALIRFGAVGRYVGISEEAGEIDPLLRYGSGIAE